MSDNPYSENPPLRSVPIGAAIDTAILAEALGWLDLVEAVKGPFPKLRRAERLVAIYGMIESDGGQLSAQHAAELVKVATA